MATRSIDQTSRIQRLEKELAEARAKQEQVSHTKALRIQERLRKLQLRKEALLTQLEEVNQQIEKLQPELGEANA